MKQASLPQGNAQPDSDSSSGISMAERGRRSVWVRALAGVVAITTWLAPLQVSLQQARQAAGALAAGATDPASFAIQSGAARQSLLRWAVAHLPVTVSFGPAAAHAAPITDPNAPVRFTPSIGTTADRARRPAACPWWASPRPTRLAFRSTSTGASWSIRSA
ncbi:hypothetical protein [Cupriavidus basilensis]|uniref:hypothetical protein n=1 Tax=Cupriavidus basilensis TaxID=68895 RepID=UPI001ED9188B|nr:hypothetical protein [Cupriavidus basilensis]